MFFSQGFLSTLQEDFFGAKKHFFSDLGVDVHGTNKIFFQKNIFIGSIFTVMSHDSEKKIFSYS